MLVAESWAFTSFGFIHRITCTVYIQLNTSGMMVKKEEKKRMQNYVSPGGAQIMELSKLLMGLGMGRFLISRTSLAD